MSLSRAEKFLQDAERKRNQKRDDEGFGPRIEAELSAEALRNNYFAIHKQVPKQLMLPMIKANAYGHGASWTAKILNDLPNLYGLGVATLEEGAEVRAALGVRGRKTRVLVFSGIAGWSTQKGLYCERHGLTPVLSTDEDWKSFMKGSWPERLSYELKFNTGMNRLGINPAIASTILKDLKQKPASWRPQGILSHLAMGESPTQQLSVHQRQKFQGLRELFSEACPQAFFHLGNSSAIWQEKQWRLDGLTDIVRPGLSLYGIPPWPEAPTRGLVPVMQLRVSVSTVRKLKPGESLGYGATFKVKGKDSVHVAILAGGYADGIHRALSNQGFVSINGRVSRFLGRVSMDLCAVECTSQTRAGDWAQVIGPEIDIWAQAQAAETIPYELLTSVSTRVQRKYG